MNKLTPSLILLVALLFSPAALAVTNYVDYVGGSDSNDGLSTNAPFKFPPGARQATGNADSATLSAGDTVKFKGGVMHIITNGIIGKWSGTAGNPITYDMTGIGWGDGTQAIITSTNMNIFMFAFTNKEWLTFNGGMLTNIGGYTEDDPIWATTNAVTSTPSGTGFYVMTSSNLVFNGIQFAEIGQWQAVIPMSGINSVTGNGILLRERGSNIVINGCEFTKMSIGIGMKGDPLMQSVTISSNYFHNYVNWSVMANVDPNGTVRDVLITRNRFYNLTEYDDNRWDGYGNNPHRNGVFFYTVRVDSTWTNNFITYNEFIDNDTGSDGGTGLVFLEDGASATVAWNIFMGRAANAAINCGGYKSSGTYWFVHAYNNTFVSGSRLWKNTEGTWNGNSARFLNNITYRQTTSENENSSTVNPTNLLSNFNTYWSDYTPIKEYKAFYSTGPAFRTFTNWQAFSLQDSNSLLTNVTFTATTGDLTDWDMHPIAGSLVYTNGTNLYDVMVAEGVPVLDFDGNALPSTGAWPIGAFASTNTPAPPPATENNTPRPFAFPRAMKVHR